MEERSRFTPTRVGTIYALPIFFRGVPVHPHTRGDNIAEPVVSHKSSGSPPHAWGQSAEALFVAGAERFTPTRVGTIPCSRSRLIHASVHPHTRGDNFIPFTIWGAMPGSPPHAWGQSLRRRAACARERFTPTRVGTMLELTGHCFIFAVHPHTRGDNSCVPPRRHDLHGSPPHAWGQCRPRL